MRPFPHRHLAGALLAAASGCVLAAEPYLEPTPYVSFADSPFDGLSFSYFHLDDFEPLTTRAPGYTITGGGRILGPSAQTDSVDADDGSIDGLGTQGSSWFSDGATTAFTITFDAGVLGSLPTHAGVVWTDVGNVTAGTSGFSAVLFEAFGPGFVPLGSPDVHLLGDFNADGGTDEDRFFGAVHAAGISAIRISMAASTDWEIDHLQFGALAPVPEPEQWLLMAWGLGTLAWRMRAKRALARR